MADEPKTETTNQVPKEKTLMQIGLEIVCILCGGGAVIGADMCIRHLEKNPAIADTVLDCIGGNKNNPNCYPSGKPK